MSKIREIIIEPSKIYTSDIFKIKIRAIRGLIYEEIKKTTVKNLKEHKCKELKGE